MTAQHLAPSTLPGLDDKALLAAYRDLEPGQDDELAQAIVAELERRELDV